MNKTFQKRFNHLQDLLKQYEDELKPISYEQANKNPENGGWTIAEVVYHMAHTEKAIIQYIQKKLINPEESKRSGLKSWYRACLLRYALRSSRKFKAPKVLDEPAGPYRLNDLLSEWKIIRATLGQTFSSVAENHVSRQLFKHPVVGKINLSQTLGFMGDHMQRHLDQIRKLKATIGLQ